ncbi:uncharacterized protein LOC125226375 [Leguminivora glycinivorella]|uniref:uncharacterized protein LOC125226375 n=1 Tax=Leguminivora glycinivorella TaxID=1035111 RepID=UPI0020104626|nr:uncharacterized protein LOC125226375 [Leguminivora glycinivorella]
MVARMKQTQASKISNQPTKMSSMKTCKDNGMTSRQSLIGSSNAKRYMSRHYNASGTSSSNCRSRIQNDPSSVYPVCMDSPAPACSSRARAGLAPLPQARARAPSRRLRRRRAFCSWRCRGWPPSLLQLALSRLTAEPSAAGAVVADRRA